MTAALGHVRRAARRLAATPGSTLVSLALLALGTGATVALFTLFNALVLRPLAVPEADRLVVLSTTDARGERYGVWLAMFDGLAARQNTLEHMTGVLSGLAVTATAGSQTGRAIAAAVTADYFRVLRLAPAAGRFIDRGDVDGTGLRAAPVCVISYGFWQRAFGGRPDAVGQVVQVGEAAFTIVGVAPAGFSGVEVGVAPDVTVPLATLYEILDWPRDRHLAISFAVGRLRAGHTLDDARAELAALWPSVVQEALPADAPDDLRASFLGRRVVVESGATGLSVWRDRYRTPLLVLLVATGWLLAIACANLAALQLAGLVRRRHELVVQRALGASRWQVVRPLALESALLCAAGTALGVPLALVSAPVASAMLAGGAAPLALDLAPDVPVWVAAASLVGATTVVSATLPAWWSTRPCVAIPALGGRVVLAASRWSAALVVGQVACSVLLLAGAGAAAGALLDLRLRDPGFSVSEVAVANLLNRPGGYRDMDDAAYYRELAGRLGALPGVRGAVVAKPTPGVPGGEFLLPVRRTDEGGPPDATGAYVMTSPGYFDLLDIPLLRGRDFTWADTLGTPPAAVISESVARRLFPGEDPIGRTIRIGNLPMHRQLEVIGIVADASTLNVRTERAAIVYVALAQQLPPFARWPDVLVRAAVPLRDLEPAVRRAVEDMGREFVTSYRPLTAQLDGSIARERLLALLSGLYASLALLMVGIGLAALLGYDVAGRLRETGIRLALGASPTELGWRVVLRGLRLTALGLVAAAPAAAAAVPHVAPIVGQTSTTGGALAAAGSVLLLAVAVAAATGPARRAARADPAVVLRAE